MADLSKAIEASLKQHSSLSYRKPTTYLLLTAKQLTEIVSASKNSQDFAERVSEIAAGLGWDAENDEAKFFCAGVASLPIWVDGITDQDPNNRQLHINRPAEKRASDASYYCRGKGFSASIN
jgi:hypothetical protein